MRIYDLECLLEVAHHKSISKTATKLYLGQTTLSAIIRSLEKELNLQIFKRTPSGLVITPLGQDALSIAEEIVNHAHEFDALLTEATPRKHIIHFLAYISACDFLMVYLSQVLKEKNANIVLNIHPARSSNIIAKLKNIEANIGVGGIHKDYYYQQQSLAKEQGFLMEPLFYDQFYACVATDSPMAQQESICLSELQQEHIASSEYFPFKNGKPASPVFAGLDNYTIFPTVESIKKAVTQNKMVAILPGMAFYQDIYLTSDLIKPLPIANISNQLINYLIYPEQNHLIAEEEILLDAIRHFYQNLHDPFSIHDTPQEDS